MILWLKNVQPPEHWNLEFESHPDNGCCVGKCDTPSKEFTSYYLTYYLNKICISALRNTTCELRKLYPLPTIRIIKSKRMLRAKHVARMRD